MKNKALYNRRAKSEELVDRVQNSSGNVFADLGYADAAARLVKARLAQKISDLITSMELTQKQAAERLGVDQPKVSALMRGMLRDFSTERLMRFVTALDYDVVISIRKHRDADPAKMHVLVEA